MRDNCILKHAQQHEEGSKEASKQQTPKTKEEILEHGNEAPVGRRVVVHVEYQEVLSCLACYLPIIIFGR